MAIKLVGNTKSQEQQQHVTDLEHVEIGSAKLFRETLNSNFDLISDNWRGVYVGADAQEADKILVEGGLWICPIEEEEE